MSGVSTNPSRENAFSLAEVCLALGIAALCLTTIFGLLSVCSTNNQTTVAQTAAAGLVSAIVADLRATQATAATSANYNITIPTTPATPAQQLKLREDGAPDSSGGTSAKYLAYLTFSAPPSAKAATPVRILITWPAAADLNNNPPKNFAGAYEVFTAMDRN